MADLERLSLAAPNPGNTDHALAVDSNEPKFTIYYNTSQKEWKVARFSPGTRINDCEADDSLPHSGTRDIWRQIISYLDQDALNLRQVSRFFNTPLFDQVYQNAQTRFGWMGENSEVADFLTFLRSSSLKFSNPDIRVPLRTPVSFTEFAAFTPHFPALSSFSTLKISSDSELRTFLRNDQKIIDAVKMLTFDCGMYSPVKHINHRDILADLFIQKIIESNQPGCEFTVEWPTCWFINRTHLCLDFLVTVQRRYLVLHRETNNKQEIHAKLTRGILKFVNYVNLKICKTHIRFPEKFDKRKRQYPELWDELTSKNPALKQALSFDHEARRPGLEKLALANAFRTPSKGVKNENLLDYIHYLEEAYEYIPDDYRVTSDFSIVSIKLAKMCLDQDDATEEDLNEAARILEKALEISPYNHARVGLKESLDNIYVELSSQYLQLNTKESLPKAIILLEKRHELAEHKIAKESNKKILAAAHNMLALKLMQALLDEGRIETNEPAILHTIIDHLETSHKMDPESERAKGDLAFMLCALASYYILGKIEGKDKADAKPLLERSLDLNPDLEIARGLLERTQQA